MFYSEIQLQRKNKENMKIGREIQKEEVRDREGEREINRMIEKEQTHSTTVPCEQTLMLSLP